MSIAVSVSSLKAKNYRIPAYLLIPKQGRERYPLAIALQGHTSGFHNSVGIIKSEHDLIVSVSQTDVIVCRRWKTALQLNSRLSK